MKKNKRLTVTVGIPAYNEEQNIVPLLRSLLRQYEKTFVIEKIIVVSDGSRDKTASRVRRFGDARVRCVSEHTRMGKPARLNQLFAHVKSDILAVIDADMIFKGSLALEKLVRGFRRRELVGLVTGNTQTLPGNTILARAIGNYVAARNSVSTLFDFGTTAYSVHSFLAYSKLFLRHLRLPQDILSDDAYSYFFCRTSRFRHVYVRDAIIYNRSPETIGDYVRQMRRYIAGGVQLCRYFDCELVQGGIKLPTSIALRILWHQVKTNPFGYVFLKALTLSCYAWIRLFGDSQFTVKWPSITTSKSLV